MSGCAALARSSIHTGGGGVSVQAMTSELCAALAGGTVGEDPEVLRAGGCLVVC